MRWELIKDEPFASWFGTSVVVTPATPNAAAAALSMGDEVDQLRVQLAGCSVAALGWNQNPAQRGDYGWSVAYDDVLRLRRMYEDLLKQYNELCQETGRPMRVPGT